MNSHHACEVSHVEGKLIWPSGATSTFAFKRKGNFMFSAGRAHTHTQQGLLDRCDSLFDVGNELGVIKNSSVSDDASTDGLTQGTCPALSGYFLLLLLLL